MAEVADMKRGEEGSLLFFFLSERGEKPLKGVAALETVESPFISRPAAAGNGGQDEFRGC